MAIEERDNVTWKKEDRKYHNKITEIYDDEISKEHAVYQKYMTLEKWADRLRSKNVGLVLDFGCGTGTVTLALSKRNIPVVSLDASLGMLKKTEEKINQLGYKAHLVLGDGENLPFRDKIFDSVICQGVLHHIPGIEKALKEISRVLKNNGIVFFSEPNDEKSLLYITLQRMHKIITSRLYKKQNLLTNAATERPLSGKQISGMLQNMGFNCDLNYIVHIPRIYKVLSAMGSIGDKISFILMTLVNKIHFAKNGDIFVIVARKLHESSTDERIDSGTKKTG